MRRSGELTKLPRPRSESIYQAKHFGILSQRSGEIERTLTGDRHVPNFLVNPIKYDQCAENAQFKVNAKSYSANISNVTGKAYSSVALSFRC
jgi:hypothetical protein